MSTLYGLDWGGPRAAVIHQDRLVLIGSKAAPDLVAASEIGDWTNFRLTETVNQVETATPRNGFWFVQSSARLNPLVGALQQEGLFLFGEQGEATVPADAPFTAAGVEARENSWFGARQGRQPLIVSGLVVFLQQGGDDIRGIAWTEAQRKYEAPSLRELAGDVFRDAVDMAGEGSREGFGPRVFVVSEDGTIAVLTLRSEAPAAAWTKIRTAGSFKGVASLLGETAFLVERAGAYTVERFSDTPEVGAPLADDYHPIDWPDPDGTKPVLLPSEFQYQTVRFVVQQPDGSRLAYQVETTDRLTQAGAHNEFGGYDGGMPPPGRLFIGLPYEAQLGTMPFVARTETGPRMSILKSRIFGLVVVFVGEAQWLWIRGRSMRPRREAEPQTPRGRQPGSIPGVTAQRYGSLSGWRRRTLVDLEVRSHCTISSLSYRASG